MKKFFIGLGILFSILVLLGGTGFAYLAFRGKGLDSDSKHYVDNAVPAIVTDWSTQAFEQREDPDLKAKLPQKKLVKIFALFKKLGHLKNYCGSKGESNLFLSLNKGLIITAKYLVCAKFENGNANIKVVLTRKHHQWKIYGFYVDSPVLMP